MATSVRYFWTELYEKLNIVVKIKVLKWKKILVSLTLLNRTYIESEISRCNQLITVKKAYHSSVKKVKLRFWSMTFYYLELFFNIGDYCEKDFELQGLCIASSSAICDAGFLSNQFFHFLRIEASSDISCFWS